jgi:hypothetical protein
MQERQSAVDHPRSDDVKGRERHDGEYQGGVGDRGDFGDQGIDQKDREGAVNRGASPTGAGGSDPAATRSDGDSQDDPPRDD